MKQVQIPAKPVVSVSDAAVARARRALSKVAHSSEQTKQIKQAAQMLPDIAVMAGGKRKAGGAPGAVRKTAASA